MSSFRERLYLSTIDDNAPALARSFGLGLEIAQFCTAMNMDEGFAGTNAKTLSAMEGVERFTFHAPFSELCPAAIDPLVREITSRRYTQAIALSKSYGIKKIVIHSGFIPMVYFPEWFVPESIAFWKEFLRGADSDITICLENVMEPDADMLVDIAAGVDDARLRLCLDMGHANTRVSAAPVTEWIRKMAPWLSHIHIHNNDGDSDLHRPLGEGILDYTALLAESESLCADVTYTVENMAAAASVDWLRENDYL
ncbi:MAG: sugar phosphate isomerase/epimerase [Oscillospiraceae bacterium]|nr:sugar phosphate isomerase/epimerase [Oscillospiraceae bacterium]